GRGGPTWGGGWPTWRSSRRSGGSGRPVVDGGSGAVRDRGRERADRERGGVRRASDPAVPVRGCAAVAPLPPEGRGDSPEIQARGAPEGAMSWLIEDIRQGFAIVEPNGRGVRGSFSLLFASRARGR